MFPCRLAGKYRIPPELVKTIDNAIALDEELHKFVEETWDEEDYIQYAVNSMGIDPDYFEPRKFDQERHEQTIYQAPKKKKKRRRK